VIHKENGGLSDARNVGIVQASGEYIVLLDSDDKFADNDTLQNLFNVIEKHKTDVVVNVNVLAFADGDDKTQANEYTKAISHGIMLPEIISTSNQKASVAFAAWFFVINRTHLISCSLRSI